MQHDGCYCLWSGLLHSDVGTSQRGWWNAQKQWKSVIITRWQGPSSARVLTSMKNQKHPDDIYQRIRPKKIMQDYDFSMWINCTKDWKGVLFRALNLKFEQSFWRDMGPFYLSFYSKKSYVACLLTRIEWYKYCSLYCQVLLLSKRISHV